VLENQTDLNEAAIKGIINIAVESWRFSRLFSRLLTKLDAGETQRYANQFKFYIKQLEDNLESAGLKIVNLEGQAFNPGMAATPLNIEDFDPVDVLIVEQMVEPVIMNSEGVVRTGTVILRKVQM
jgi:hypothetical protein